MLYLSKKYDGVRNMIKKVNFSMLIALISMILLLSACGENSIKSETDNNNDTVETAQASNASDDTNEVSGPHDGVNQEPIPIKIDRDGTDVFVEMTTQITDINIAPDETYKAWTFNGEAPGPLIVIDEGDTLHITLDNMDPRSEEHTSELQSRGHLVCRL